MFTDKTLSRKNVPERTGLIWGSRSIRVCVESSPSSLSPELVASPHCSLATCMRYDHAYIGCTDAESTGVHGDVDEDDRPQASSASARSNASVSGTPRTPGRSRVRANSREDSQIALSPVTSSRDTTLVVRVLE